MSPTGEVLCTLQGKCYILKPTFGALCHIELKTQCSILELAAQALDGTLQVTHAAAILNACMVERVEEEVLGDLILSEGLVKVLPSVHALMKVVLEGTLSLDD
ncbi:MAG: GTA-gp10 family protein [Pseudomonadota bacterium]|nr:GTA-gp10 family protein [Pseudomonadota bacterium]